MANHAYVHTQKPLTIDGVERVLKTVNQKYFFDLMVIEFDEDAKSWYLHFEDVDTGRSCWVETETKFELRHGGGPDFIWWADALIQDEIAREFDGQVEDDGVGTPDTKTWGTAFTFKEYIQRFVAGYPEEELPLSNVMFVYRHYLRGCSKQYMRKLKNSSKAC